MEQKRSAWS